MTTSRHNQHARENTYPPAGFTVPPAALFGMERFAVYPLFKLRTGHRAESGE